MMPDDSSGTPGRPTRASPQRWREVSAIVDGALDVPDAQREAFLAERCPTPLREEVDRLLRAMDRSGGFLEQPASGVSRLLLAGAADAGQHDHSAVIVRLRNALAARYTIDREIGRGGMAIIHLARDCTSGRQVAIKVLRPELVAAVGAERFLREIDTVARLAHPNILPLLDSGHAEGLLWYAMPYVAGETLRERLNRQRPLPAEEAAGITIDLAAALAYAHAHGVLHRDLKPENVLLADGQTLLTDFGIARAIRPTGAEENAEPRDRPLTGVGVSLGTPAYMSPEQASGSRELDGRSDIYALGCMLYEMLAGNPPFRGPTAYHVIRQHLSAGAPDVSAARAGLSPGITTAVGRALAKAPDGRHASMEEFADALRSTLPTPSPARHGIPGSRTAVSSAPARLHWRGIVIGGAIAILALALIAVITVAR